MRQGSNPGDFMTARTWQRLALSTLALATLAVASQAWAPQAWALSPLPPSPPVGESDALRHHHHGLEAVEPDGRRVAFALQQTMVRAEVLGHAARVEVRQRYQNPLQKPMNATYRFPLPDEAAVDEMEIQLGERTIFGQIKPKEEARAMYQEAQRTGRTAGLLEQVRANLFVQQLANVKPGESIEVVIRYTQPLPYEAGDHEFFFPMAAAPRYNAPGLNPPTLMPGQRSPHRMDLEVRLDPGFPIGSVQSATHKVQVIRQDTGATVRLDPNDAQANRDFRLRYRVAGPTTEAHVVAAKGPQGGHFLAYLTPALNVRPQDALPRDLVFLMDTSGSQSGFAIEASKRMMEQFIAKLGPRDTFNVVDFAATTEALSPTPLANNAVNRSRALAYVAALDADGGTELRHGIDFVLKLPAASQGRLRTIVMLTDGLIGGDDEVIASLQKGLKQGQRLLVLGTGSSVNTSLLNRMAAVGRGAIAYVTEASAADSVAQRFAQKLGRPVLRDISLRWEGSGSAPEFLPALPRDLYAAEPLVVAGRQAQGVDGVVVVSGLQANGRRFSQRLPVRFGASTSKAPAQLWARAKLQQIEDEQAQRPYDGEAANRIRTLAMAYGLLSKETAFVAVTKEVRVDPQGQRVNVEVPVEMPPGMFLNGHDQEENSAVDVSARMLGQAGAGAPPAPPQVRPLPAMRPHPYPVTPPMNDRNTTPVAQRTLEVRQASQGLERRARLSLKAHLAPLRNQAPVGAWESQHQVEAYRLPNGKVALRGLKRLKASGADAAFLALLEQRLLTWEAPTWVLGPLLLSLGHQE